MTTKMSAADAMDQLKQLFLNFESFDSVAEEAVGDEVMEWVVPMIQLWQRLPNQLTAPTCEFPSQESKAHSPIAHEVYFQQSTDDYKFILTSEF